LGPRHAVPEERALACLIGGAIGDALGYEMEIKTSHEPTLARARSMLAEGS
jgi:ADP-ribosylglycohydrolase